MNDKVFPSRRHPDAVLSFFAMLMAWLILAPGPAAAIAQPLFSSPDEYPPQNVDQSLSYLLNMVGDNSAAFDPAKVQPLLEFIAYQADTGKEYELQKKEGARGACLALDIFAPLSRVLQYVYDPAIPAYAMYPTVVRRSAWLPGSDILRQDRKLWELAENLTGPVVLRGDEFEEITPDMSSGGYYSYDLRRLLILTPFKGRPAFISGAEKKGPSSVGKKGAVIDGGRDWTFVYSKEEGLTKGGIGWMDTFMYDSFSVTIYIDVKSDRTLTRYGVFSWLKAGWASINVIKPRHIYDGCTRAAQELKRILESTQLPEADRLALKVEEIRSMSDDEMVRQLGPLSKALAAMGQKHPILTESEFAEVLDKGRYAENLSREERTSLLIKEYLKKMMGKPSYIDSDTP